MNIYYRMYDEVLGFDYFFVKIENETYHNLLFGKVLKINKIVNGSIKIGGVHNFQRRYAILITDLKIIKELDKLTVFQ